MAFKYGRAEKKKALLGSAFFAVFLVAYYRQIRIGMMM